VEYLGPSYQLVPSAQLWFFVHSMSVESLLSTTLRKGAAGDVRADRELAGDDQQGVAQKGDSNT